MSDQRMSILERRIAALEQEVGMHRRLGPSPPPELGKEHDRRVKELVDAACSALQKEKVMVRGKFQLQAVTQETWMGEGRKLKFGVCYDKTIPEDQNFAKATPTGTLEMQVDNPAALAQLEIGKYYYLDLTPVD